MYAGSKLKSRLVGICLDFSYCSSFANSRHWSLELFDRLLSSRWRGPLTAEDTVMRARPALLVDREMLTRHAALVMAHEMAHIGHKKARSEQTEYCDNALYDCIDNDSSQFSNWWTISRMRKIRTTITRTASTILS